MSEKIKRGDRCDWWSSEDAERDAAQAQTRTRAEFTTLMNGEEDINADADAICNHCGKEHCGCEVCGNCSIGKPRCFRHEEEKHD